ncbi:MFS general substrate transporter [Apiospora hydei]|uniref:MFS general substrate transporter n=1 Tax=Apiospora hydei TaxID=1337664 RepID=A0ABR1X8I6_9PEZI
MRETEESPLLGTKSSELANSLKLSSIRQILIVGAMAYAGLLNVNRLMSNVSTLIVLPAIQESLNIPVSRQQLITSMYSIYSGCMLLLYGRLADVHGRKRVFLAGAACFTASSIAIPFAPDEVSFYALRVLQGFSNAATVPSTLGILAILFPQGSHQRKWAFVTFSVTSSLEAVVGNLFGGIIGAYLSWHWVFWIPAGIAALVGLLACGIVPPVAAPSCPTTQPSDEPSLGSGVTPAHAQSVDWIGGMTITASMLSLLLALSYATVLWSRSPFALLGLVTLSAGLAGAFSLWQRRLKSGAFRWEPLIRASLFANTDFSVSLIVMASFCGSYNSFLVFASVFPRPLTLPFYLVVAGILCSIATPLLYALPSIPPDASYWAWGFPAMCLCFSIDIVWPVVGLDQQAIAGGALQTSNLVGRAVGLAVAASVQVGVLQQGKGQGPEGPEGEPQGPLLGDLWLLRPLRAAQWTNVGLAVLALLLV